MKRSAAAYLVDGGDEGERSVLGQAYKKYLAVLNKSALETVKSVQTKDAAVNLSVFCQNYLSYLDEIRARFLISGSIFSFGNGDCGQLGHGIPENDDEEDNEMNGKEQALFDAVNVARPKRIAKLNNKKFKFVACGGLHNLAIDSSTLEVYSWGCGDNEVLGREGDENFPALVKFPIVRGLKIIQVSAGDKHSVALDISGNVYCWGAYSDKDNKNFFLRDSYETDPTSCFDYCQPRPMKLYLGENDEKVVSVESGSNHTLALTQNGEVYSWGIGDIGQLGREVCELKNEELLYNKQKIVFEHLVPQKMRTKAGNIGNIKGIACGNGGYHNLLLNIDDEVFGCGLNQYCQLGFKSDSEDGNMVKFLTKVDSLSNKGMKLLKAGEHFTLGLTQNGDVYSVGRCDQSQLGIELPQGKTGAGDFFHIPQLIVGKDNTLSEITIKSIACGSTHSILISSKGECFSFGFGESNQLGHGKAADEILPRLISKFVDSNGRATAFNSKAVFAACGGQHSVILIDES